MRLTGLLILVVALLDARSRRPDHQWNSLQGRRTMSLAKTPEPTLNDSPDGAGGAKATVRGCVKALGPGVLYAGAAIGGSHLVQSTQAGAYYGWALLWAVLLANLAKYPFFEFVYRYQCGTGRNMLEGYDRCGRWMLWAVALIVVGGGVLNVAAVTVIGAALGKVLFGLNVSAFVGTALLLAFCLGIILLGRYPLLDKVTKGIMALLAVCTVVAFGAAVINGPAGIPENQQEFVWNAAGIAFLLALMGWMPTPIDGGIWPSLWAEERKAQTGYEPRRRERMTDFYIGYIFTAIMAIFFMGLGAMVMYGTTQTFESSGIAFANQLVSLYTQSLGDWSWFIVALAAFTTMLSTTLTCLDAWPMTTHRIACIVMNRHPEKPRADRLFWGITAFYMVTTLVIAGFFMSSMLALVHVAMLIGFLTAPLMAAFNYMVILQKDLPDTHKPPMWLHGLSWFGLVFLTGFALLFIWSYFLAG